MLICAGRRHGYWGLVGGLGGFRKRNHKAQVLKDLARIGCANSFAMLYLQGFSSFPLVVSMQ
jgi:hypothetical protein